MNFGNRYEYIGGSSPRMRGALSGGMAHNGSGRIIPAYLDDLVYRRDHPRVCGEHKCAAGDTVECRGSSPRMRGAQLRGNLVLLALRIIPAYAGSTQ